MATKETIAAKLLAYLQHRTTLAEVVAWAEQALLDADYKDDSAHTIRNILAQLGLAEVKLLGLSGEIVKALWKDLALSWK
jgi:hypothetical protein